MSEPSDDRIRELGTLAFGVAHRILASRADAEDVAQEAVTRTAIRWWRVRRYAEPFTIRVATNLALGVVRKRRDVPFTLMTNDGGVGDTVDRLDLVAALDRLPRRQREVVVLRYVADFSERDVADALRISPGSVKTHSSRGLAALRTALSPSDDVPAPLQGGLDVP